MRRMTSVLLSLSAVLATSALVAPAAGAAPGADRPAAAPAGWEAVDAAGLARITEETNARKAPLAADAAAEPELLAMQSVRNGRFVATEANYAAPNTGVLRARSAEFGGSWEGFSFEYDEATETYALKSLANDRYVAVEKNYTGSAQNVLRARSTSVGGWERFILYYSETLDRWALQSTLNGMFVTMENGYTGSLQYALRARSAEPTGSWEEFVLYDISA
ncbi:putative peroxidase [Streptomyces ambofaciens ATCC 23877]|uniref:Putative peroxidase n=2 Tax=Streptomyces ambofaciens TaxID=1889 RepID=A0A0K2B3J8_STRA7|nr:putative peroxidase [Streptomyces ambofaciens ATCC 23877]